MKHLRTFFCLLTLVFLCGCGGENEGADGDGGGGGTGGTGLNIAGNWQLGLTSNVGTPPSIVAGSITQTGSSLSGALHMDGSACFDYANPIRMTGTLSGSNISLTSTSVDEQVITFKGSYTNNGLTGTYAIDGGCANGDQGSLSGFRIPAFSGTWRVGFEISDQHFYGLTDLTQSKPSPDGSSGIAGTITDSGNVACLSGQLTAGSFPLPSYIMGTSVALEVKTDDGTVVIAGHMNQEGTEINGSHNIVGGACDGFGGAVCFARDFHGLCKLP